MTNMRNIKIGAIFAVTCVLLMLFSCHSGKSTEEAEMGDTIWNEKIQDTFYGCKFGEPIDSVLVKMTAKNFKVVNKVGDGYITLVPANDSLFTFGGMIWNHIGIKCRDKKFLGIGFFDQCPYKVYALDGYDVLCSKLERKYQYTEEPGDSLIYKRKKAFGRNGARSMISACVFYESPDKPVYCAVLTYTSDKLNEGDMEEL